MMIHNLKEISVEDTQIKQLNKSLESSGINMIEIKKKSLIKAKLGNQLDKHFKYLTKVINIMNSNLIKHGTCVTNGTDYFIKNQLYVLFKGT